MQEPFRWKGESNNLLDAVFINDLTVLDHGLSDIVKVIDGLIELCDLTEIKPTRRPNAASEGFAEPLYLQSG